VKAAREIGSCAADASAEAAAGTVVSDLVDTRLDTGADGAHGSRHSVSGESYRIKGGLGEVPPPYFVLGLGVELLSCGFNGLSKVTALPKGSRALPHPVMHLARTEVWGCIT
jgi:hypothetical protein